MTYTYGQTRRPATAQEETIRALRNETQRLNHIISNYKSRINMGRNNPTNTICRANTPPSMYNEILALDYLRALETYTNEPRDAGTHRLQQATAEAAGWQDTHRSAA